MIAAKYRSPNTNRSIAELAISLLGFAALWAVAVWALSISIWLTLLICIPAAGFLVRLFIIQHDCGHGSYFESRKLNDWAGRSLGVLTATPYLVWRKAHAQHHAGSGNLDKRGRGAIHTLTVDEFRAKSWLGQLGYRLFRNPITLFIIGPAFVFLLQNRVPVEFFAGGWVYWLSAMGTNVVMAMVAGGLIYAIGLGPFLTVFLTTTVLAATIGVWLFYMQHQFEHTEWDRTDGWQIHHAALNGSSYYKLPRWLEWLTGNIGIHHVHHLNSRIPFYRLPEILRDHAELADINPLTVRESIHCANLHLWDAKTRRLVSFAQAKHLPA
ncbi:UNVERIFIED_CONTAM: hypothetical protein GTU68_056856 [Idotea baltica]|nr:hypothetical protein [Idotea baltica]